MKPRTLKDWEFVKSKSFNLTMIGEDPPESYYYQLTDGVYYPVIRVIDMDDVPEPRKKTKLHPMFGYRKMPWKSSQPLK